MARAAAGFPIEPPIAPMLAKLGRSELSQWLSKPAKRTGRNATVAPVRARSPGMRSAARDANGDR